MALVEASVAERLYEELGLLSEGKRWNIPFLYYVFLNMFGDIKKRG